MPEETLLCELFLHTHTCSYLPAAGERLGRSLAGFTSDTSTANCQTGFLEVDADKQLSALRELRPESVSVVSQVVSCFNVVLLLHILIGIACICIKRKENPD